MLQPSVLSAALEHLDLSMLTFRPVICAVCEISSSLPARVMIDVTALQLNLHSQGPPA